MIAETLHAFLAHKDNEQKLLEHCIRLVTIDDKLRQAWLTNLYEDLPHTSDDTLFDMFNRAGLEFDSWNDDYCKKGWI